MRVSPTAAAMQAIVAANPEGYRGASRARKKNAVLQIVSLECHCPRFVKGGRGGGGGGAGRTRCDTRKRLSSVDERTNNGLLRRSGGVGYSPRTNDRKGSSESDEHVDTSEKCSLVRERHLPFQSASDNTARVVRFENEYEEGETDVVQAKKIINTARVFGIRDEKYLKRESQREKRRKGAAYLPRRDGADTSDRSRGHREQKSSVVVCSVD